MNWQTQSSQAPRTLQRGQGVPGLLKIIQRFPEAGLEQLRLAVTRALVEMEGAMSPRKLVQATSRILQEEGVRESSCGRR